jgi:hypothetical protein
MLLTDGCPNDTEALRVYESAVLDIANMESIDLVVKLRLALDEIVEDVLDILLSHSTDMSALSRRMKGVSDVVVTPQLKRWHAVHALEVFYRDAFNNQLNDRYQVKSQEYRDLARIARLHTVRYGIGLVNNPIPQADLPVVTFTSGAPPSAVYYIQVSWVSGTGQEGAPSKLTAIQSGDGQVPVIQAVNPPQGATGFNVYVSLTDVNLQLQNSSPVAVSGSFVVNETGPVSGRAPGDGQTPDLYVTGGSNLIRG